MTIEGVREGILNRKTHFTAQAAANQHDSDPPVAANCGQSASSRKCSGITCLLQGADGSLGYGAEQR
jgi:hypothetical protein